MRWSIFVHHMLCFFTLSMVILSFKDQSHCSAIVVSCCRSYDRKEVTKQVTACYTQSRGRSCTLPAIQLKVGEDIKCFSPKTHWLKKKLKKDNIKCVPLLGAQ